MRKRRKAKTPAAYRQLIADTVGIPGESLVNLPYIRCEGKSHFHCINHDGVIAYSEKCLRFKTGSGEICVEGENLRLRDFGIDAIAVEGKIDSISFI